MRQVERLRRLLASPRPAPELLERCWELAREEANS